MKNFPTKSNPGGVDDSGTSGKFGAKEFNSLADENEGVVTSSGQTLTTGTGNDPKTNQLSQAASIYSMGASSFQDSGVANAYIVTPVTGASGLVFPEAYSLINGARINFIPGNDNTGASTLNIGQTGGTLLGTKKILSTTGTPLAGGELLANTRVELVYDPAADSAAGAWIITDWSLTRPWVELVASKAWRRPNGLIEQYETGTATTVVDAVQTITYPVALSTEVIDIKVSTITGAGNPPSSDSWFQEVGGTRTLTSVDVIAQNTGVGSITNGVTPTITVIGR